MIGSMICGTQTDFADPENKTFELVGTAESLTHCFVLNTFKINTLVGDLDGDGFSHPYCIEDSVDSYVLDVKMPDHDFKRFLTTRYASYHDKPPYVSEVMEHYNFYIDFINDFDLTETKKTYRMIRNYYEDSDFRSSQYSVVTMSDYNWYHPETQPLDRASFSDGLDECPNTWESSTSWFLKKTTYFWKSTTICCECACEG